MKLFYYPTASGCWEAQLSGVFSSYTPHKHTQHTPSDSASQSWRGADVQNTD